jgi:predicted nuclease of predicted toxin-antitoxin system
MTLLNGFYFDEHINRNVARGLNQRGYHVIMAVDVGMIQKDDDTEHLPYAIENNLVLVTFDHPFAGRIQILNIDYPGMICLSHNIEADMGQIIQELADFAELYDPMLDANKVHWLP